MMRYTPFTILLVLALVFLPTPAFAQETHTPTHLTFETGINFDQVSLEVVKEDYLLYHKSGTMTINGDEVIEPGMYFFINLEEKLPLRNFFEAYSDDISYTADKNKVYYLNFNWGAYSFSGLEPVKLHTSEDVASYLKEQTTCPKGYWYDGAECVKEADYQPFTFEIVPNSFTINADQSSATIISNLSKFVNQSTTQSIEFSLLHQTNTQNIQCSIEDVRITCAIQENENSNTLVQILANDSKTALNQTINVSSLFVAPQSQNQPTQNTFTGGTRTTQTNVGDVFVVQEEEPAQEFTQNTTTQETEQPEEPSLEVETPFGPGNQTEDEPDNLITGQITGPLGAQAITIASIFIGLLLIVSIILIVIFMRKN